MHTESFNALPSPIAPSFSKRECQVVVTTSWRLYDKQATKQTEMCVEIHVESCLSLLTKVSSVNYNIPQSVERLRYGLDNRRTVVRFPAGATDFATLSTDRPSTGLTQSAIQCKLSEHCHGIKRPGHDADNHFHLVRRLRNSKPKRPLPRAKGQLYL